MQEIMQGTSQLMYQTSYQASYSKENCFKATLKNLKNISDGKKYQPVLINTAYSTYHLQDKPEQILQESSNQKNNYERLIQDKIIQLEKSHSHSIVQQRRKQSLENQKFLLTQIQEKRNAQAQQRQKSQNYSASLQISESNNSKMKQQYIQELKQQIEEQKEQRQQNQYLKMRNNKKEKEKLRLATEQEVRKSRQQSAKKQRETQESMEKDFQNKSILKSREQILKKLWAKQSKYQLEQYVKQESVAQQEKKMQQEQFANFLRSQIKQSQTGKKEEHKKMFSMHNSANFFDRKLDQTPQKSNYSHCKPSSNKKLSSQKISVSRFLL